MKQVTLPTSPEIRARLNRANWFLPMDFEDTWTTEVWRHENDSFGFTDVVLRKDKPWECEGDFAAIAQFMSILGLVEPPPGMVLVSCEIAERAESALTMLASDMSGAASRWDRKKNPVAAELSRKYANEALDASRTISAALSQSRAAGQSAGPCTNGHDKVYSPDEIATLPPIRKWVCRRCHMQGEDRGRSFDHDEYARIFRGLSQSQAFTSTTPESGKENPNG